MKFQDYLQQVQSGKDLDRHAAEEFMEIIMEDESLSDEQLADVLSSLTQKGPTVEEVYGFVIAMRRHLKPVAAPKSSIDTCGTGGDKLHTFNISTAAALLTAAGDITVAKHGNRAATSLCGSADVLQEMGIPIDLDAEMASQSLYKNHFAFLFAPYYHPALKRLSIVRKQLGYPTVFNLLGPLLNPALIKRQVIGTYSAANSELLAQVMTVMEYTHAIVLTSDDGLDEAGLTAPISIIEIKGTTMMRYKILASDFGLAPAPMSSLKGGDAVANAKIITNALQPSNAMSPAQRVILFNSGLAFYVSGAELTIHKGIQRAQAVLESGEATILLNKLRAEKNQ